ncbi:MAG: hypothetical protein COY80_00805 [Candidatus Pacebacteria bacterium CG_4_10_14_0_8_um_filter_42_14]|nr:MAG: hypothetical protein COY80_00805 [Candidatus Pacebacteria bacterium CG_4_10_14_0_8_um_filter_42_14]
MKSRTITNVCLFVIFATLSLLMANKVGAQSNTGMTITVTPATAYLKILPGNRETHTITIVSQSSQVLEITPKVVDFRPDGRTGQPILSDTTNFPYLVDGTSHFPPIILQPKERAQLTLAFNPPAGSPDKEYPMTVIFTARPASAVDAMNSASEISGAVASNIIVLVSKEQEPPPQVSIKDFGTFRLVDSFGLISLKPIAENESFAAIVASGSASIKNWQGKPLAEFPLYPDSILGLSTRELRSFIIENTPENESEPLLVPKPFQFDKPFLFGIYRIGLVLNTEEAEITLVALPFSIIVAILVGAGSYGAYTLVTKRLRS